MISIIVPNYNHVEFLPQRLNSIFNQTLQNYEVILLDDCSTDGSWEYLKQFKNHPKVSHCIRNEINSRSPFGLWELGFSLAKGDYIWIAESDDFSSELFLEKIINCFKDDSIVLAHCKSFDFLDENNYYPNKWLDSFNSEILFNDYTLDGQFILENFGRFKCPVINVSSAVFRSNILTEINIPYEFKYAGDWHFWSQILCLGKVSFVSEPLNYFRLHDNSATSSTRSNNLIKAQEYTYISKYICHILKIKFNYHNDYYWLLIYWKKIIYQNPISSWKHVFKNLPLSFVLRLKKTSLFP